jgi:hypothetical protein
MVSSSLWSVLLRNRPLRVLRVLKVLRLLRVTSESGAHCSLSRESLLDAGTGIAHAGNCRDLQGFAGICSSACVSLDGVGLRNLD